MEQHIPKGLNDELDQAISDWIKENFPSKVAENDELRQHAYLLMVIPFHRSGFGFDARTPRAREFEEKQEEERLLRHLSVLQEASVPDETLREALRFSFSFEGVDMAVPPKVQEFLDEV